MIAIGVVWGATNALMRRGTLIWDQQLKSSQHPNRTHNPVVNTLKNWLNLLLMWQYSVPFLLNLSASATFFAILNDTPISLAVPVTNATTFAATALFGLLLGEETRVWLALFGTFLIVLGVYICIMWLITSLLCNFCFFICVSSGNFEMTLCNLLDQTLFGCWEIGKRMKLSVMYNVVF